MFNNISLLFVHWIAKITYFASAFLPKQIHKNLFLFKIITGLLILSFYQLSQECYL